MSLLKKIEVPALIFLLFILSPAFLFAGGIASIEQIGDSNSTILTQGEFDNKGIVFQSGENNSTKINQNNPADYYKNQAIVSQGSKDVCTGCIATVTQSGSSNIATINQDGINNSAQLEQFGNDNQATFNQEGDNNLATFNQEGDNNTALSSQTGNDNAFEIIQENSNNFVEVLQFGGAGSGPGGPITLTQSGGGNATIIQGP